MNFPEYVYCQNSHSGNFPRSELLYHLRMYCRQYLSNFLFFILITRPGRCYIIGAAEMGSDKGGKDDKAKAGKDGEKAKDSEKKAPAPQLTPRDGVLMREIDVHRPNSQGSGLGSVFAFRTKLISLRPVRPLQQM